MGFSIDHTDFKTTVWPTVARSYNDAKAEYELHRHMQQTAMQQQQMGLMGGLGGYQAIDPGSLFGYSPSSGVSAVEVGIKEKKENQMLGFRDYIRKHSDLVWTILVVAIMDHFILKGVLRKRLTETLEGFLTKIGKDHCSPTTPTDVK